MARSVTDADFQRRNYHKISTNTLRAAGCTAFAEEIKIAHSSTEQRNILQASEVKFMRRSRKPLVTKKCFCRKKKFLNPLSPTQKYNGPSLPFSGRQLQLNVQEF